MKELKAFAPYITIMAVGLIAWGSFSARLDAVERKADSIELIKEDLAVIKAKLDWMEGVLIRLERR